MKNEVLKFYESFFNRGEDFICCDCFDNEKIYRDAEDNLFLENPNCSFSYSECLGKFTEWIDENESIEILLKYGYKYSDNGNGIYTEKGIKHYYEEWLSEWEQSNECEEPPTFDEFMNMEEIEKITPL